MTERTALGEAILNHWRAHCPHMVRDLRKHKRLNQALFQAQEQTGDLLYDLVSVRKMDYQAAWELAMQEWALRQDADRPQPGTSGSRRHQSRKRRRQSRTSG